MADYGACYQQCETEYYIQSEVIACQNGCLLEEQGSLSGCSTLKAGEMSGCQSAEDAANAGCSQAAAACGSSCN
jgi:hypothetical protein